jgi:hypothetical protein
LLSFIGSLIAVGLGAFVGADVVSELNHSEREKIDLEHQAAKLFMRWFERETGNPIRHLWHNRPAKPDVSCRFEGDRLDLEVAHLYGSEQEAMQILGRELDYATRHDLQHLEKATEPHGRLVTALNRISVPNTHPFEQIWIVADWNGKSGIVQLFP